MLHIIIQLGCIKKVYNPTLTCYLFVLINTSIGFRFRIYTDQAFSFQMTLWNDCDKNDQMRYDLK
jgi:hypothetical protein